MKLLFHVNDKVVWTKQTPWGPNAKNLSSLPVFGRVYCISAVHAGYSDHNGLSNSVYSFVGIEAQKNTTDGSPKWGFHARDFRDLEEVQLENLAKREKDGHSGDSVRFIYHSDITLNAPKSSEEEQRRAYEEWLKKERREGFRE